MQKEIYLILDNIRSRENVGSIFRTADGAGVKKIFLCGITPKPCTKAPFVHPVYNIQSVQWAPLYSDRQQLDKISKTALGAEKWVPWEYRCDTWRVIMELKKSGVFVLGLENTKDAENIFMLRSSIPKHLALVLGNEVRGLSSAILKKCDKIITIPMYGRKESLNVAVATGIALYFFRKISQF